MNKFFSPLLCAPLLCAPLLCAPLLFAPLLMMAGCGPDGSPGGVSSGGPIRGIAASIVAAQAFDQLDMSIRHNNDAGLESAGANLRKAADAGAGKQLPYLFIAALSQQAGILATRARYEKGEERFLLEAESDQKYRIALSSAPAKSPEKLLDPTTLNGIGYFLADRGHSRSDFEKAALYTKAAYDSWPKPTGRNAEALRVERAINAQDSYAWALFKLKRYEEAKNQAEEALGTARALSPKEITAEIPFHMAEIYRALGDRQKASFEYRTAMTMTPDAELKAKINYGIYALDFRIARVLSEDLN